jgi:lipoate-protein ligase A
MMPPIPQTWRLIDTGPLDGAANMAVDEAILASYDAGCSLPVLRLYGWSPPALSVGRFQDPAVALDLPECSIAGVPVIRRITGGGIIYHADELTYSLVCESRHIGDSSSVKESFRRLTSFILSFYNSLGLEATYAVDGGKIQSMGQHAAFCFAGREPYDILIDGMKIGGNAQRRVRSTIFQHGSIPLIDRSSLGNRFLRKKVEIEGRVTSLAGRLEGITLPLLKMSLTAAFMKTMGVELRTDSLTEEEQLQAASLLRGKYLLPDWNISGVGGGSEG